MEHAEAVLGAAGSSREVWRIERSPRRLPRVLQVCLQLSAALLVVDVVVSGAQAFGVGILGGASWIAVGLGGIVMLAQVATFVGTSVAFLAWLYRAHERSLEAGARGVATPDAAVTAWLIPGVNVFVPRRRLHELWRETRAAVRGAAGARARWIDGWWAAWIGGSVLAAAATAVSLMPGEARLGAAIDVVSSVVLLGAARWALRFVREIERAHAERSGQG